MPELLIYTRKNSGRLLPDKNLNRICTNEKFCILNRISMTFVPKGLIDSKSALVQIMAWRRTVITLTNANPVHRRIYAAPGADELI